MHERRRKKGCLSGVRTLRADGWGAGSRKDLQKSGAGCCFQTENSAETALSEISGCYGTADLSIEKGSPSGCGGPPRHLACREGLCDRMGIILFPAGETSPQPGASDPSDVSGPEAPLQFENLAKVAKEMVVFDLLQVLPQS